MRVGYIGIPVVLLALGLAAGCAMQQKKVEKQVTSGAPVNCATAQGDLRLLHHEKANVAERVSEGVTMIYPAGLVIGVLTGTEGTKYRVATGEYNKQIDARIAEIKETCNIE
jgi:hypothetical protein